jgi:hypothetical protein
VREETDEGWPHLHIAWRGPYLDQAWLSEQWERLSGSKIVDIRLVQDQGRAAAYMAKYMGKGPKKFGDAKRYWQSESYRIDPKFEPQPLPDMGGPWIRSSLTLYGWMHAQLCAGLRPRELRPGLMVAERPT